MMEVKSIVNIPVLNLETEKQRWNTIYKVLSEPKPDIKSTPRKAVWKKTNLFCGITLHQRKSITPLCF